MNVIGPMVNESKVEVKIKVEVKTKVKVKVKVIGVVQYHPFYTTSSSACSEHSCSSCRSKASVLPHHARTFGFALASGSAQN